MDYAHSETDKLLEDMERRVAAIYKQASEEAKEKLDNWYKKYERLDEEKRKLVEKGKITQKDYIEWRKGKMMEKKRLQAVVDDLTDDFVKSDKIAMGIVSDSAPDVFALNANYTAYDIEQKTRAEMPWTMYDKQTVNRMIRENPQLLPSPSVNIPLDTHWNKSHITNAITQGILQGEAIPDIAKRLERVVNMDYNTAVRSARTATTAAECAGRTHVYKKAESMGIELEQEWLATLDGRTRHAHRQLDGQRVPVGQPFQIDGYEIEYPGDPKAPGYLIYNCRCTTVAALKGDTEMGTRSARNPETGEWETVPYMSYQEWANEKVQKSLDNSGQSGIIDIGKSLGAKAKNYNISLPNKEVTHLTEGTRITNVKVIAGKGRNRVIDEVPILLERYPGSIESEWQKAKGIGYVDYDGESYKAELHWYQEPSVGRVEWKVKPDADGNWFIEED